MKSRLLQSLTKSVLCISARIQSNIWYQKNEHIKKLIRASSSSNACLQALQSGTLFFLAQKGGLDRVLHKLFNVLLGQVQLLCPKLQVVIDVSSKEGRIIRVHCGTKSPGNELLHPLGVFSLEDLQLQSNHVWWSIVLASAEGIPKVYDTCWDSAHSMCFSTNSHGQTVFERFTLKLDNGHTERGSWVCFK